MNSLLALDDGNAVKDPVGKRKTRLLGSEKLYVN
jgi:hypothetical protein